MIRSIFPVVWLAFSAFGATFSLLLSAWFLNIGWLIAAACCLMTLAVQLKSEPYRFFRLSLDTKTALVASVVCAALSVVADQSAAATTLVVLQMLSCLAFELWYSPFGQVDKTNYQREQELSGVGFEHMDAQPN